MSTNSKQILIVDDEEEIRQGVERWLKAVGYSTYTASDGEECLDLVAQQQPDAILLDVRMPRKDGMETLACLRASHSTLAIPVVMLSASLRDQQRAMDAGAKFFVQKPYDGRKLITTLRSALELA